MLTRRCLDILVGAKCRQSARPLKILIKVGERIPVDLEITNDI